MVQQEQKRRGPRPLEGEKRRRYVKTKYVNVPVSEEMFDRLNEEAVPPLSRAAFVRSVLERELGLVPTAA